METDQTADDLEMNGPTTELFTPGEPAVDADGIPETTDDAIGPWSDESLEEYMADLEEITGAEGTAPDATFI